jgi:hypothetical protein
MDDSPQVTLAGDRLTEDRRAGITVKVADTDVPR